MERPLTFQELHRQRQRAAFVGRAHETTLFEKNLQLSPEDPQRRSIIGVSGQGGMGKTTFMGHCRDIARGAGFATAWTDEEDDDLLAVMKRLVDGLNQEAFSPFTKKLEKYRELRHNLESNPEAPDDFGRLIGATAGRAGVKLARRVPVAGVAAEFLDDEVLGSQVGEIASYVLKKAGKKPDADLLLAPVENLTPLFLKGLGGLVEQQPVGIFFDTFEQTKHMVEAWLLRILNGQFGDIPLALLISISGRYPLDLNSWGEYEKSILRIELQPFSEAEAKDLLAREGVTEAQAVNEMIRLSHGLPILLTSMAARSPDHPLLTDTAVDRVLRSVPEDLRKAAIEASITRWLNRDLIKVAIEHSDPETVFDWLIGMPFVLDAVNGWKYHDVIRSEFLLHGRRESPQRWLEGHRKLSQYFEQVRDKAEDAKNWEAGFRAELEHVYHGVCTGDGDKLAYAVELCVESWGTDPRAILLWAFTIKEAESDSGKREENSLGQAWLNAADEWAHGRDQAALDLFGKTLSNAALSKNARVKALVARGDLYFNQSRLDAALDDLNEAVELQPENPRLRHERAWIHWRAERIDEALADSRAAVEMLNPEDARNTSFRLLEACVIGDKEGPQQSLATLEEIPDLGEHSGGLLTRGRMLRDLGKSDAAIRSFKEVVNLERGNVREAWIEVGTTYEKKGKPRAAAEAYRSAIEIDPESIHAWRGLGRCLNKLKSKDQAKVELLEIGNHVEDDGVSAFRAAALSEMECFDAAEEELKRAIGADPSRPDFRLWMAEVQAEANRWGDAARQVTKALQLRPKWPMALALRGLYRAHVNDHAGALADWTEAEAIDPAEAKVIDPNERGLALSVVGRYREARAAFDRVDPGERGSTIVYNRAIAAAMELGVDSASDELAAALRRIEDEEDPLTKTYGEAGLAGILLDEDKAFPKLEEALKLDRTRTRKWAETDPAWSRLREGSHFKRLIQERDS